MAEKEESKNNKTVHIPATFTIVLEQFMLVELFTVEELNEKYGNLDALMTKQPSYILLGYSLPTHGFETGSQYVRTVDTPKSSLGTIPDNLDWIPHINDDAVIYTHKPNLTYLYQSGTTLFSLYNYALPIANQS